jgi:hypothetical protein
MGIGAIAGFSISQATKVRMVHLCQTGPNSNADHGLVLSALELFGEILEPSQ